MADSLTDQILALLPPEVGHLQRAIAEALVRHTLVAGIGPGPILGTNSEASQNCRICMDTLAGEVTLRHQLDGHNATDDQVARACGRSFHLTCLVAWVETSIRERRPATCPGDREVLLPDSVRDCIYLRFSLAPPVQHQIRGLDTVIPFWNLRRSYTGATPPPHCSFTILHMDLEYILGLAAQGYDVGFVSSDVLRDIPMRDDEQTTFEYYDRMRTRVREAGSAEWQPVYQSWIYLRYVSELFDHETGEMAHDYIFVPVMNRTGRTFRRYLHGVIGPAYYIWFDQTRALENALRASVVTLEDYEVVNLHAEVEIRQMMQRDRASIVPPPVETWYWPFPNQGGGIALGGRMPNTRRYPARGYNLTHLNLGFANDSRYALLAAMTNGDAAAMNDALVDDYRQGRLPPGFPNGFGLERLVVHVPLANMAPGQPLVQQVGTASAGPPGRAGWSNLPHFRLETDPAATDARPGFMSPAIVPQIPAQTAANAAAQLGIPPAFIAGNSPYIQAPTTGPNFPTVATGPIFGAPTQPAPALAPAPAPAAAAAPATGLPPFIQWPSLPARPNIPQLQQASRGWPGLSPEERQRTIQAGADDTRRFLSLVQQIHDRDPTGLMANPLFPGARSRSIRDNPDPFAERNLLQPMPTVRPGTMVSDPSPVLHPVSDDDMDGSVYNSSDSDMSDGGALLPDTI